MKDLIGKFLLLFFIILIFLKISWTFFIIADVSLVVKVLNYLII